MKKEDILKALSNVVDPDMGIDIVSLGLVYEVKIKKTEVIIIFTLTSPSCPYADFFVNEVEEAVKNIEGVTKAEVKLTFDPLWTPERMDPDIRAAMNL